MRALRNTGAFVIAALLVASGAISASAQTALTPLCQARSDFSQGFGQEDRSGLEAAAEDLMANAPPELAAPTAKLWIDDNRSRPPSDG